MRAPPKWETSVLSDLLKMLPGSIYDGRAISAKFTIPLLRVREVGLDLVIDRQRQSALLFLRERKGEGGGDNGRKLFGFLIETGAGQSPRG